jgi:hypothetical protein
MMRKLFLILVAVSVLFLASAHRVWASSDHISAQQVTADDKAFFQEIKQAIESHDAKWIAENINLPLNVNINGKKFSIKTEKSFIKNYDNIITTSIVDAVRLQDENDMFKNWQGIMIGRGQIWFGQYIDEKVNRSFYYIKAINN